MIFRKKRVVVLLILLLITQQGCLSSLISAPFQIVGHTLNMVGRVFGLVGKLPKPPPGVIPGIF